MRTEKLGIFILGVALALTAGIVEAQHRNLPPCTEKTDVFSDVSFRFEGTSYWGVVAVGAQSSDALIYDLDRSRFRSFSNRFKSNNVKWRPMTKAEKADGQAAAANSNACLVSGKTKVGAFFTCSVVAGEPRCK